MLNTRAKVLYFLEKARGILFQIFANSIEVVAYNVFFFFKELKNGLVVPSTFTAFIKSAGNRTKIKRRDNARKGILQARTSLRRRPPKLYKWF